jgi:hypothetical protein
VIETIASDWMWAGFIVFVLIMLALDLIPIAAALGAVAAIIVTSIILSLAATRKPSPDRTAPK